jgi:hypothetical protein
MMFTKVLPCLFVLCAQANLAWGGPIPEAVAKLPPYIPAEYQDAVSKVLPGYEILRNKDFVQDETQMKKFISPDEIAARKKREALGFIVGRFNDDQFQDFAAWVVNRSIKQEQPAGRPLFAARLVVCLGTSTPREYRCEILPTIFGNFASLPFWADLEVVKIGGDMLWCGDDGNPDEPIAAFYPEGWNGKRPSSSQSEVPARKLRPNYDAIGESRIGVNAVTVLVRRAEGGYLDCAGSD